MNPAVIYGADQNARSEENDLPEQTSITAMERQVNRVCPRALLLTHPESEETFLRFTQQLNLHLDADQFLRALPSALHTLIPANTFWVLHTNGHASGSRFYVDSRSGRVPPLDIHQGRPSACVWVQEHQRPLVIPSVEAEDRFPDSAKWFSSAGDKSLCILPLRTSVRQLGVLCAGRASENAFSDKEIAVLTLAADYAALAMDDRLNFAASEMACLQLENEQKKLKLILDLNNSIVSNLELKQLIQAISPSIRKMMQIDAVALVLPSAETGDLELHALDFPDSKGLIRAGEIVPLDGRPGDVFRTGEPWIGDISDERSQYFGGKAAVQAGLKSLCLLPLMRCGRVLGVLSVARRRKHSFTQQDVEFLLQISGQVAIAIDNALAYRRISELSDKLTQEKLYLEDEIRSELNFEEIIGNSAVLRRVLRQVEAVAPTNSTVLIQGETGSGKELIARAVHKLSRRSAHSFVKLNCAAIPTGLLESELFGHEKGAFTGAIAQRVGRFELASEGTIFLDEIGEIPLELQPKLLRVLQEREFERLGNSRTLYTKARLIAATNRDLNAMVENQRFRPDLFYRLNVFPIHVPPLRERREDIPVLVWHFARQFAARMKRSYESISTETMNSMVAYPWPGNIRELQNVIERAVILCPGPVLRVPARDLHRRTITLPHDGHTG